jgi:hypothetical protein
VLGYKLDDDSLKWHKDLFLLHIIQTSYLVFLSPINSGQFSSARIKRPWREADRSPPYIAKVNAMPHLPSTNSGCEGFKYRNNFTVTLGPM